MKYKCTECGKDVEVLSLNSWKYKTHKNLIEKESLVQCSYTCYDHALLRKPSEQSNMFLENLKKEVIKSENAMRAQGKTILHPINTKKKKLKGRH